MQGTAFREWKGVQEWGVVAASGGGGVAAESELVSEGFG